MRLEKSKRPPSKEPPAEIQELVDPGTESDSPKVLNKTVRKRGSRPAGSKDSGKARRNG
jgi:hypothetical protein